MISRRNCKFLAMRTDDTYLNSQEVTNKYEYCGSKRRNSKVHMFWEGHRSLKKSSTFLRYILQRPKQNILDDTYLNSSLQIDFWICVAFSQCINFTSRLWDQESYQCQELTILLNLNYWKELESTDQYMQYLIIRNGLIRNSPEFLGKFKKRALGRSNLRNASKKLKKRSVLRFSKLRNEQYPSLVCNFKFFFIFE